MQQKLRKRRERHLVYIRLGLDKSERYDRLAEEFDVKRNTVVKDEGRMEEWIDDVRGTASFEEHAGWYLYQHRSQTEGQEQLARSARQERQKEDKRVEELRERLDTLKASDPADLQMDEDEYWNLIVKLNQQLDSAQNNKFKWAREERQLRTEIASEVREEIDIQQSLGKLPEAADEVRVSGEVHSTEKKVYANVDVGSMPGLEDAQVVGMDTDVAADIEVEDTGSDNGGETA